MGALGVYFKKNNVRGAVNDNPLASGATTLNLQSGQGAIFPSTFPFLITIWDDVTYPSPSDDPNVEICEVTGRSTDALTIVRGWESTTPVQHAQGQRVEMLITAGIFNDSNYGVDQGLSGISGYSGFSGQNPGASGYSGVSGYSGYSGQNPGASGYSGFSGYSGSIGLTGTSGYSGYSGISGYSGFSGISGYSGFSGISGYSGYSGTGPPGTSGYSGYSGISGYSGYSGISGYSGYSGYSGISGYSGTSGYSGYFLPRTNNIASSGTPTPNSDTTDEFLVTALAVGATFAAPTGSPISGQSLIIRIKDNGTAQSLAWNSIYRAGSDLALPTTTVISKTMYCGFIYNYTDTKWDFIAFINNF